MKFALSVTQIALGIVSVNPCAIISGVFDLLMFAGGFWDDGRTTNADLARKLSDIDEKLSVMDHKLDQMQKVAMNIRLNVKANTVIGQITPVTAAIGTLWMQTKR